jgi:hypothetical protein
MPSLSSLTHGLVNSKKPRCLNMLAMVQIKHGCAVPTQLHQPAVTFQFVRSVPCSHNNKRNVWEVRIQNEHYIALSLLRLLQLFCVYKFIIPLQSNGLLEKLYITEYRIIPDYSEFDLSFWYVQQRSCHETREKDHRQQYN